MYGQHHADLPITIATFLNSKILKFKNFFRSAIFVPTLTSVIVAGIAFRLMFGETEAGLFNSIILKLGGEIVAWKTGYVTGMIMMVTLAAWRELGINMVYCLSALQSIPEELYEAADIDGANAVQKFVFVTIPPGQTHHYLYPDIDHSQWVQNVYRRVCVLE